MIINSKELKNGSLIESEIIIIGGGIAGITLANYLSQAGHNIAILESGGEEPDYQTQSLYAGSATMCAPGIKPRNIDTYLLSSRLRYFGGSGNHWDGLCVPLDPVDFIQRDWIPYSGWPFTLDQLKPYYDNACDLLEIPRLDKSLRLPHETGEPSFLKKDLDGLTSRPHFFTKYSGFEKKGRFNNLKYKTANYQNVKVYLNANVTNIVLIEDGQQVKEVQITCLNGLRHHARGEVYILATGGIENARLLLASNSVSKSGIGNHSDWLGRCFQGHASFSDRDKSSIFFTVPKSNRLYQPASQNIYKDYKIWYITGTAMKAQLEARTSNFSVYTGGKLENNSKLEAIKGLALSLGPSDTKTHIGKCAPAYFPIEHTPNRESRITLMPEKLDDLGMPRVKLEWRNSELDFDFFERSLALLVKELGINNAGRVRWSNKYQKTPEYLHYDRSHHIGTTRMSVDPNYGVVNEHCKMHGVNNLYIAGSSVFPTSGIANPTITIVALTFRMVDHLHKKLNA